MPTTVVVPTLINPPLTLLPLFRGGPFLGGINAKNVLHLNSFSEAEYIIGFEASKAS